KLKITFSIPEKYAAEVKSGSIIDFKVSGSDKTYNAKIYAIEPEVAVATRTLQIRALADNNDGKLFPGTFADVKLPLNIIKDAIVVPSQAIIPIQDGKKVFIANNGQAKEVMVDATTRTDSSILILSGLKPGDTLITSGVMSLKDEAPIKVKVK
ncbi:MAG: efflux RND transporter periplasmic adaptor subunit, partial [Flavobacterium nitrogenifigens]